MRPTIFCPTCTSQNKTNKLILYQINMTTAVYLCQDRSCTYPKGHEWIEVNRTLEEMTAGDSNPNDLDNWLDNLLNNSEISTSGLTDSSVDTTELLSQICGELENISDTGGGILPDKLEESFYDMQLFGQQDSSISNIDLDSLFNVENVAMPNELHNNVENSVVESNRKEEKNSTTHLAHESSSLEGLNMDSNELHHNTENSLVNLDPPNLITTVPIENHLINSPPKESEKLMPEELDDGTKEISPQLNTKNVDNIENTDTVTNHAKSVGNQTGNKTIVIVKKDPNFNVTKEQILEIVKKLPPSKGKTIVLNITNNSKLKGISGNV